MIDVVYTLRAEDGGALAERHIMLLPPWAGQAGNAIEVAQTVCEEHLDDATWAETFFDSSRETLDLEIHAPADVAGQFRVEVRMRPKAEAVRVPVPAAAPADKAD
jgi:hypothetical protein